jgi:hypothetical protein
MTDFALGANVVSWEGGETVSSGAASRFLLRRSQALRNSSTRSQRNRLREWTLLLGGLNSRQLTDLP